MEGLHVLKQRTGPLLSCSDRRVPAAVPLGVTHTAISGICRCPHVVAQPASTVLLRPPCLQPQVGDLQPWMDESFLYNIFVGTNQASWQGWAMNGNC